MKPYYGEINMGNSVYSTPIVADNVLYIANRTHLFAIEEGAKPVEANPLPEAQASGCKGRRRPNLYPPIKLKHSSSLCAR